jgi:hypothetical protein
MFYFTRVRNQPDSLEGKGRAESAEAEENDECAAMSTESHDPALLEGKDPEEAADDDESAVMSKKCQDPALRELYEGLPSLP